MHYLQMADLVDSHRRTYEQAAQHHRIAAEAQAVRKAHRAGRRAMAGARPSTFATVVRPIVGLGTWLGATTHRVQRRLTPVAIRSLE